jgi:hypothetical protein
MRKNIGFGLVEYLRNIKSPSRRVEFDGDALRGKQPDIVAEKHVNWSIISSARQKATRPEGDNERGPPDVNENEWARTDHLTMKC